MRTCERLTRRAAHHMAADLLAPRRTRSGGVDMRSVRHFWLPLVLSSAVLFLSTAPAAADTIRITSGFVELGGAFDFAGAERGFRMIGSGYGGGAGPNAYVFCEGDVCNPGDQALLQHAFGGLDLFVNS